MNTKKRPSVQKARQRGEQMTNSAAPLPKLTPEFLGRTQSAVNKATVDNVIIPVMAEGTGILAVAAKAYTILASKSASPEQTTQAFDAKANSSGLVVNDTDRNFSAGFNLPAKPSDIGRA